MWAALPGHPPHPPPALPAALMVAVTASPARATPVKRLAWPSEKGGAVAPPAAEPPSPALPGVGAEEAAVVAGGDWKLAASGGAAAPAAAAAMPPPSKSASKARLASILGGSASGKGAKLAALAGAGAASPVVAAAALAAVAAAAPPPSPAVAAPPSPYRLSNTGVIGRAGRPGSALTPVGVRSPARRREALASSSASASHAHMRCGPSPLVKARLLACLTPNRALCGGGGADGEDAPPRLVGTPVAGSGSSAKSTPRRCSAFVPSAASADLDTAPLAHGAPAAVVVPSDGDVGAAGPADGEGVVARVDRLIAELDRLVRRA